MPVVAWLLHTGAMIGAATSPLPSQSHQLAILGRRARGYRAVAELLCASSSDPTFDEARAILAGSASLPDPLSDLNDMLVAGDLSDLLEDRRALMAKSIVRCRAPAHPVRGWACVAVEVAPDDRRITELLVLASLTELFAWKTQLGNLMLADALHTCRQQFLIEHAGACLSGLADGLQTGAPLLARVGRTLARLLEGEGDAALFLLPAI